MAANAHTPIGVLKSGASGVQAAVRAVEDVVARLLDPGATRGAEAAAPWPWSPPWHP